jgi:hypothetical protein
MDAVKKLIQVFILSISTVAKKRPDNVKWSHWHILRNTGIICDWEYFPPIWFLSLKWGIEMWWDAYGFRKI